MRLGGTAPNLNSRHHDEDEVTQVTSRGASWWWSACRDLESGANLNAIPAVAKGSRTLRFVTGVLAAIGLMVVLIFVVALGVFAYDEAKRRLVGDEFAPEPPTEAPAS